MNLKETYNRIAEDWFKDHKSDDWWVDGTNKFLSFLSSGDNILDAGCGAGVKSKYLKESGFNVTGIDFSEKFIEIAKREVPEVEFQVMDLRNTDKLNQKFNGVFAQASLLHISKSEIVTVIGKLVSILKPEGYFYVAVKGVHDGSKEEDVVKENDYGYEYERFFSYYTMSELENYLNQQNLNIVYKNSKLNGRTDWLQIIGQRN